MIYSFQGLIPVIDASAFIHPGAVVIGNVFIGKDVYIGPGAVLRGDWGKVAIGDGCNVQENCVLHMFPGKEVLLEAGAHVGHGAIVHGAHLGENTLVGMNAVLMDDVLLGKESIVGALSFIPAEKEIPPRSLVVGNPAKVIKAVSDEMLAWKTEGTRLYQQLPAQCRESLTPCEPLREAEPNRPEQAPLFKTWRSASEHKKK